MVIRRAALALAAALLLGGCGITDARDAAIAEANTKPLSLSSALRPGLVGLFDYPATGWEPSTTDATDDGTIDVSLLAGLGLHDEDLTEGLFVDFIPDGDTLATPTLDFCGADYPSERARLARAQTAAFTDAGEFVGLSSEVVVYASPAAAQQALREVTAARKACPTNKAVPTDDGHDVSFTFHSAPGPSNTPLVPAAQRLIIHTTMKVDGKDRRAFLVYQITGRVLSAFYASSDGATPYTQDELDLMYGMVGTLTGRLLDAPEILLEGEELV